MPNREREIFFIPVVSEKTTTHTTRSGIETSSVSVSVGEGVGVIVSVSVGVLGV